MSHALRLGACLTFAAAAFSAAPASAESGRFSRGVALGDAGIDLRVADAIFRGDGRWLTLGTRVAEDNSALPYLVLREAGGAELAAVALAPSDGRSWSARSLVDIGGGHVLVAGIDHDASFGLPQALFLVRLDAGLGVVWSRRYTRADATFEDAWLRAREGAAPLLVGGIQPVEDGMAGQGDAFLASVDVATGDLADVHTLGTPEAHERGADVIALAGGGEAVALEVRRDGAGGFEAGDGIVALADDGSVASSRLISHPVSAGIRASALRLIHDGAGFVLAGRRTAFGPNFFYLHRLGSDLAPAAGRTLLPFFNAADIAPAAGGGTLLYGEANGEVGETGTVLMRLDADLGITLQRRYPTQNQVFPSGAIARGDRGLLLALGAMREDDARVFESAHRVDADGGEGLLCEEGSYEGFATATDTQVAELAWTPAIAPLALVAAPVAVDVEPLVREDIAACATRDDLIFRDGFP